MSDQRLRELERRVAEGDGAAEAPLLAERVRAGTLAPDRLRLAAHLGHPPAREALGDDAPVLMTDKDAIKCAGFADPRLWRVPAVLELAPDALWSVRKSVDVMRQRWDARKGAPVPAQPALDKSAEHG